MGWASMADITILSEHYIRDCRKSPNCTFLLFPHLVKSTTYKSWLVAKLRVLGFFDSLYFNPHFAIWEPATISRVSLNYSFPKNPAELWLRFFVVICTYLFRTVFRYESRLRIPFCISTRWSVPLRSPQRLKNTIPYDTAMQNNYLIYHANQCRIPTSSILGFLSFLIGTSLVSSFVWDSSLTGAQELPSQQDLN